MFQRCYQLEKCHNGANKTYTERRGWKHVTPNKTDIKRSGAAGERHQIQYTVQGVHMSGHKYAKNSGQVPEGDHQL